MAKRVMAWGLTLFVLFTISAPGQSRRPPLTKGDVTEAPTQADDTQERMSRDMAKKANVERHNALKNDANKLLQLANELKDDVDKSNENVLSLDVLKKAEEIEKLAKSVKEKMKGPN